MRIRYEKLRNILESPIVWRSTYPVSVSLAKEELQRMKEKHEGLKIYLSNHHMRLVMETYETEVCNINIEICDAAREAEFILKESL